MKKVITAVLVLSTIGFFSCTKKIFTCECSYDENGTKSTVHSGLPSITKVDADASCDTLQTRMIANGFANTSCFLK
ncbi:hypothetical protein DBR32_05405 [Taibaiella sp. KBW10]|uniref:hypothetical protein n=1 Tax=Taibaiella sp. KBW10 TaxID=2153357 RepID=UPI000F595F3A|nr:hypothetical protein [Taibaiella sp. KBW10]RQO31401.1 hypothetical protein DBR32_05405 [Taibaiella sp. KBW10]